MNNVSLIGHVAVDTKVGSGVASSLLAVHRIYKSRDGQDTDFIPLSIFGKQAENFSKMVQKGEQIGIDGRIKTSTYADENGEKKYGWTVAVDHFYLLNSGHHDDGQQKLSQQSQPRASQPAIDKQLKSLDSQLEKAGIQFD
jgi:single-strand DNA-binding protein